MKDFRIAPGNMQASPAHITASSCGYAWPHLTYLSSSIVEVGIKLVDYCTKLVDRSHSDTIGDPSQHRDAVDGSTSPHPAEEGISWQGVMF